jgi:hypothetical protein
MLIFLKAGSSREDCKHRPLWLFLLARLQGLCIPSQEDKTLGVDGAWSFPKHDIRLSQVRQRGKEENGPSFRRI